MTLAEQLYVVELFKGLLTTNRHFWRNWIRRKDTVTLEYPEEKREYPARWRGLHRLMLREDGTERCVACMMCATNCPAECMTIEAGEHDDPVIEKMPAKFEIDLLKCIFCGFCAEACPCDAIRLDTGMHAAPGYTRDDVEISKKNLLSRGTTSIARQGGKPM